MIAANAIRAGGMASVRQATFRDWRGRPPGGPILPADEIILAKARSHSETIDLLMYASVNQSWRVGVGFDGRGNSDTFSDKRRHFFSSRYGDMKSAGPISPRAPFVFVLQAPVASMPPVDGHTDGRLAIYYLGPVHTDGHCDVLSPQHKHAARIKGYVPARKTLLHIGDDVILGRLGTHIYNCACTKGEQSKPVSCSLVRKLFGTSAIIRFSDEQKSSA